MSEFACIVKCMSEFVCIVKCMSEFACAEIILNSPFRAVFAKTAWQSIN